jgi:hypothetical protein
MKRIFFVVLVLLLFVAGIFFLVRSNKQQSAERKNQIQNIKAENTNISPGEQTADVFLTFSHPDLNFSFDYPAKYKISLLDDGRGQTVLIQEQGRGAQVYISDFAVKDDFNSGFVRQQLAGQKLNNLLDIALPGGFKAVSFLSHDESLGEIWDVWFVKDDNLYQITSQPGQDELLKKIVESFRFE